MTLRRWVLLGVATVLSLSIALPGCSSAPPANPGPGPEGVPPGHQKAKQGGPPPWAPAHGYRRKHSYVYYPNREVYYDPAQEQYVWLDIGGWKIGRKLPREIEIDLGNSVNIELDGDDPRSYHHQVKAYYPPGQAEAAPSHPGKGKAKGHNK